MFLLASLDHLTEAVRFRRCAGHRPLITLKLPASVSARGLVHRIPAAFDVLPSSLVLQPGPPIDKVSVTARFSPDRRYTTYASQRTAGMNVTPARRSPPSDGSTRQHLSGQGTHPHLRR